MSNGNNTYNDGIAMRRAVMGDAHVERSMSNVTPFTAPLQDWINEHAWGSTWQRGVLDKKNTLFGYDGFFNRSEVTNRAQGSYSRRDQ